MDNKTDWVNEKFLRIEELTDKLSFSKYNLLKISFLKRLVDESFKNASNCETCKTNLPVLQDMIEEIPHLDLIDHRSPYEKKFNAIRTHFHKKHGFVQPYQFTTIWTLIGISAGIAPVIVWLLLVKRPVELDPLLAGAAVGLVLGYVWGSLKDGKFRKAKKII
ncbi:MAG: hypothetical protein ACERKD_15540 [Prolixibacteraceae bacterium]